MYSVVFGAGLQHDAFRGDVSKREGFEEVLQERNCLMLAGSVVNFLDNLRC